MVRIYHPVTRGSSGTSCTNAAGSLTNLTIEAAILTLKHSFTVDNYYCGKPLGTLTVKGAIAQKFRGPVGTGSGQSISSGYAKAYSYDSRLQYRSPPSFLDPAKSDWSILKTVVTPVP
jgi:hypothetical protein